MTQPTSPASLRPILILVTAIAAIWFSGRASGDEYPLAYDGQTLFYTDDVYGIAPVPAATATPTNVTVVVHQAQPAVYHLVRPNTFATHRRRLSRYDRYFGHGRPIGVTQSRLGGPVLVDTLWTGR